MAEFNQYKKNEGL